VLGLLIAGMSSLAILQINLRGGFGSQGIPNELAYIPIYGIICGLLLFLYGFYFYIYKADYPKRRIVYPDEYDDYYYDSPRTLKSRDDYRRRY
jgi:hypothetical protein